MDNNHSLRVMPAGPVAAHAGNAAAGASMPPIHRSSMLAQPWQGVARGLVQALWSALVGMLVSAPVAALGSLGRLVTLPHGRSAGAPADVPANFLHGARFGASAPLAWERAAARRRNVLLALIIVSSSGATALLDHVLPAHPSMWLRGLQIGLFGLLFAWVAAGFFTAVMGFWVLLRGDRHAMSAARAGHAPIAAGARTAIIMPICNEQVSTVFAGLRATWESLVASGEAAHFDLYILSDTGNPEIRAAELAAWGHLRQECAFADRIYYRW